MSHTLAGHVMSGLVCHVFTFSQQLNNQNNQLRGAIQLVASLVLLPNYVYNHEIKENEQKAIIPRIIVFLLLRDRDGLPHRKISAKQFSSFYI